MLNMSQINHIRELKRVGFKVPEIARELKVDPKTVLNHLKKEDYSPKPPVSATKPSILDPYKATINSWLEEDKQSWYKQRHTAQRVYDRLLEIPGYNCSYQTVQRYVRSVRRSEREQRANQELVWHPGEAQADFGEADFIERGERLRRKYLVVFLLSVQS